MTDSSIKTHIPAPDGSNVVPFLKTHFNDIIEMGLNDGSNVVPIIKISNNDIKNNTVPDQDKIIQKMIDDGIKSSISDSEEEKLIQNLTEEKQQLLQEKQQFLQEKQQLHHTLDRLGLNIKEKDKNLQHKYKQMDDELHKSIQLIQLCIDNNKKYNKEKEMVEKEVNYDVLLKQKDDLIQQLTENNKKLTNDYNSLQIASQSFQAGLMFSNSMLDNSLKLTQGHPNRLQIQEVKEVKEVKDVKFWKAVANTTTEPFKDILAINKHVNENMLIWTKSPWGHLTCSNSNSCKDINDYYNSYGTPSEFSIKIKDIYCTKYCVVAKVVETGKLITNLSNFCLILAYKDSTYCPLPDYKNILLLEKVNQALEKPEFIVPFQETVNCQVVGSQKWEIYD